MEVFLAPVNEKLHESLLGGVTGSYIFQGGEGVVKDILVLSYWDSVRIPLGKRAHQRAVAAPPSNFVRGALHGLLCLLGRNPRFEHRARIDLW